MTNNLQIKYIIVGLTFLLTSTKINAQCSGLITGRITHKEKPAINLTVNFLLADSSIYTTTTDSDGRYLMPTIAANSFEIISITPQISIKPPQGISTLDMVFIMSHILGLKKFEKPFQYLAADTTNDGKVSAADLVEVRSLILGVILKYTNSDFVRFMYSNNTFPIQIQDCNIATNAVYNIEIIVVGDVNP